MKTIQDGQCGSCRHFGETHPVTPQLAQLRQSKNAMDEFTDECGHPTHAKLHLLVTPTSGCDGYEALKQ